MSERISLKRGGKKYLSYTVIFLILIAVFVVIKNAVTTSSASDSNIGKLQLKPAQASQDLNRDILIPLSDEDDENQSSLTMKLENVELRDEIIVQGQKASSVAGRSFFVINVKMINPLEQGVEVNTKDYLRLAENGKDEWLAPDIHNDPVLIQAISTKQTRLAFPVDANVRNFRLQVGEISGEKEIIEINF